MRHQDLTINHKLESFVYANTTARITATGFVAGDVGRIAYQTDTGEYWRLTDPTPTWARVAQASPNTRQTSMVTTAGTSSTSPVMAGLSGTLTPISSGKVWVTITGRCDNDTLNCGVSISLYWGPGSVGPAHGAAISGTAIGSLVARSFMAAGAQVPFSQSAIISGLPVNSPIWIDLAYYVTAGGTATLRGVTVAAFEL